MTSAARYDSTVEQRVLEELRPRYESRGYRFVVHPERASLPAFMRGYVPDAVATKAAENVAIEVKGPSATGMSDTVESLRRLFVGHDDWRFTVVYGGSDPQRSIRIPPADITAVRKEADAIEELLHDGHDKAALVMAFALLEAGLPMPGNADDRQPRRPGSVVQTLAMDGLVSAEQEARLRGLTDARNRIVHGDLEVRVSPDDVRTLLDVVKTLPALNDAVATE